jgi:hypothetical protein
MKKSIGSVFLAFVFLTVILSGCAPALTPVPSTFTPIPPTDTPAPTSTPIPPTPTLTSTPTLAPIITDGEWTGQDSQNNTIKFVVKDKHIISFIFEKLASPNCFFGYDSNEAITPAIIEEGKFALTIRPLFAPSNNTLLGLKFGDLNINGVFIADIEAKGTATLSDKDCGINMTWTAEKTK